MNFKLLAAAVAFAALPSIALASPSCTTEPQSKWMSQDAMKAKVASLGYQVKVFKITGSCYEIYGKTKDGKRAEVYFNPVSGEIVKSEIDG
ncbi:hypothetical protein SAMN02745172_04179 [Pseudoxanthobacter soli DSM 19599]|uniref:PepSY domain-containing protein n=1 Tax=Pseudoxanthobacter soli DSM 19599 TaxID=1123029 RepID=A0A1M7ZRG0_9HYPH|nr:PepSY domain-containing protein [Pseudoxanthobacter soli]SHO67498.1 hypothetical protein SAMN02745172_04179 [Pseudoxanthobacter soli DSM 19599]